MNGEKRPRTLRRHQTTQALAGAIGLAMLTPPALAEEVETEAPIIVTGHRPGADPYADPVAPYKVDRLANGLFTEPLLDTPKGVTALSSGLIDDLGATTFRDLFRTQPGVTLGTGEGGNAFGDRVFIRGFDARNDVYVDGVRDPGVGSRETFAIDQIEILRGPSSTFGGRGTTGGAVSLVSKRPEHGNWGDVDVTLGSDNTRRVALDVNGELTGDFAVRVNLMAHESDVAGRDYVFNNRWGAALAALYRPTDALELGFDYFHLTTDYMPDWGMPYDAANNRPFDVGRDNFYGVLDRDFGHTFSDIYTARAEYRFSPNARLHTLFRYGDTLNAYTASAPEQPNALAGTVNANAKRRDMITTYFANQTNLTLDFGTGAVAHTLVAGFEVSHEHSLNRTRTFTECATLPCTGSVANPVLDLWDPDATIPWPSGTAITGRPIIVTDTQALYLVDTIKFNPQWRLLLGARYDDYSVETRNLTPSRASQSAFFNWHAGLVYKPTEAGTLYASYSSSSNPACEQIDATALDYAGCDPRVVNYSPIENRSYELGAKANLFDGHFNVTAAIFQIARTGVPIALAGGAAAALGLQDQQVSGLELTVAGNVTPDWSLFGGVTLLDTEISDSDLPSQIGARLPNVAERSFTLTSRHQLTDRLHLGGTAIYSSEKYGGTVAAGTTFVPAYWRFDLFGGYDVREGVEISFNVLNLTDEVYYDALYRSATPFTYIAPGRSAHLTLDIDF